MRSLPPSFCPEFDVAVANSEDVAVKFDDGLVGDTVGTAIVELE
jgi:hypothetical protein